MTSLIRLDNICLAYGLYPLLEKVTMQVESGERICLIGRNGAGKSSLLKVIMGECDADQGFIWRKPDIVLAKLSQTLPQADQTTVYDFVASGLLEIGQLLADYHGLTQQLSFLESDANLKKLEKLQNKIDHLEGWHYEKKIMDMLDDFKLNPNKRLCELSGGWLRKAELAKVLVRSPQLLLLDEPTNHFDIDTIIWLEEFLLSSGLTLIFITHDRSLLKRLATRIVELEDGKLSNWPGDYALFLTRKEAYSLAKEKEAAEFDKKLAQEEQWIRQGIKARRTRNEGRASALKAMRLERSKRREKIGQVHFALEDAELSGQRVIEAEYVSYYAGETPIIKNFSANIMRGDKIGFIGKNGAGKTTLIKLLLGEIQPDKGKIILGTKLKIAYFDQQRFTLDLDATVRDNVAEGMEFIEINGKKQHIMSYLNDFLFSPARALTPVKALSGGECNRLLLAKLFSQPANLLVLDEPTNDLDIETLELLEECLLQYQGTLLLVSHDRSFIDQVVTSVFIFEEAEVKEYIGGYEEYESQRKKQHEVIKKMSLVKQKHFNNSPKKLSYQQQQELADLPSKIETLEKKQSALQILIAKPDFYEKDQVYVTNQLNRLQQIIIEQEEAYKRWQILDNF